MQRKPTAFEEAVYAVVRQIPKGEVRSYQWVAQQLGKPKAVRAVGNALNRNPYAPAVPCHRVVGSNGRLGGFADGCERKRLMLQAEGVNVARLR
jgi:methylated-DNA-[protein]-cysteine S-methyltransferase